jgi:hypothetical protein
MIQVKRATDVSFQVIFTRDGVAINITGYTLFFTVKALNELSEADTAAPIKKDITQHSDPTHGITTITLTDDDTDLEAGTYAYDIKLKNSQGVIQATENDQFVVTDRVTIRET